MHRLLIAVALLDSTVKIFYDNSLRFFLRYIRTHNAQHATRIHLLYICINMYKYI